MSHFTCNLPLNSLATRNLGLISPRNFNHSFTYNTLLNAWNQKLTNIVNFPPLKFPSKCVLLKSTSNVLHPHPSMYKYRNTFFPDSIFPRINNSRCVTYIAHASFIFPYHVAKSETYDYENRIRKKSPLNNINNNNNDKNTFSPLLFHGKIHEIRKRNKREVVASLTGLHQLKGGRIVLLERLIEPRLGEILERIAGILGGGSAAVLHSPCRDVLLAADTLARPPPARRTPALPSPLLPRPRVALVASGALLVAALGVDSDHGHLTTRTAIPGQHWAAGITGIRALIDTQQLVCRIDDVHAKRMVSPWCSPDRASNLPICWLPWLLLPPPLLLLLLPRLSAEPTSLPANSSFMSPPRVTLPGHANSRIFLAREPPSTSPPRTPSSFYPPWRFSGGGLPFFLPSFSTMWVDGGIMGKGGVVRGIDALSWNGLGFLACNRDVFFG